MQAIKEAVSCIREFNRFYTVRFGFLDQSYLGTGFSITEMRVLFEIHSCNGVNAKTLSDRLRMDKSYISRVIRSMMQRGLLFREVSAEDRRSYDLQLTEAGRQEMDRLIAAVNVDIEKILAPFDGEDQKALCEAMQLIMEKLSK